MSPTNQMSAADLDELRQATQAFLVARSGEATVREVMQSEAGWSPDLWKAMCTDLGLAGIAVPESHGGAGGGIAATAAVFEETGASLACVPLLSATLASQLLVADGTEEAAARIPPAVIGGEVVALALTSPGGRWRPEDVPGTTRLDADGSWRVSGTYGHVLDGAAAAELLVLAQGQGEPVLLAVPADDPGVRVRRLVALDLTRPQAEVTLTEAAGTRASAPGRGTDLLRLARTVAAVCLASEQAGGARRVLDDVVRHALLRRQFGRPIGSFQAVKHACAQMLVLAESATSAARGAAAALDASHPGDEAVRLAEVSAVYCSRAYREISGSALQLYGGLGFTWEHSVHLHLKRARSGEALFGSRNDSLDAVADLLAI
jgi:alkylation response protein AidB-like acyl-CoA dehydrogenase